RVRAGAPGRVEQSHRRSEDETATGHRRDARARRRHRHRARRRRRLRDHVARRHGRPALVPRAPSPGLEGPMSIGLTNVVTTDVLRKERLASGQWDERTLWGTFAENAEAQPRRGAVVDLDGERSHSYGELRADVNALSAILAD